MIAIAAMSENRVIGCNNSIPWHIPEDFRWFKKKTMGGILVMGRKTFESIGKVLPGRETIVVSSRNLNGVNQVSSLTEVINLTDDREIFICGGGEIYNQTLYHCNELFLTIVKMEVDGDTFFPEYHNLFDLKEVLVDTDEYKILHYVNKNHG